MQKRTQKQKVMRRGQKRSQPDKVEKILEDYPDVFADIVNVLVYNGRRAVAPENLQDGPTLSRFKAAEGNVGEKNRDVVKLDMRNRVCYAVWGLENQSVSSNVMPVRVLGYDYASYEWDIRKRKAENKQAGKKTVIGKELPDGQKLSPVVTVVLYFGEERWGGAKSLHEMLEMSEELAGVVADYPANIIEVSFLEEEIIDQFQSDFRNVARFFRAKRLGNLDELLYNQDKIEHVEELLEFFRTFTGDNRYRKMKKTLAEKYREEEIRMCSVIDEFMLKGEAIGLAKGEKNGKNQMAALTRYLLRNQRMADLEHAANSEAYMDELLRSSDFAAWVQREQSAKKA